MSRSNKKPQWNEPVAAVVVAVDEPIEDTIEVGVVSLEGGPLDPAPLTETGDAGDYVAPYRSSEATDFAPEAGGAEMFSTPEPTFTEPAFAGPIFTEPTFTDHTETPGTLVEAVQDKGTDVAQKTQDAVQGATGQVKDAAADVADKAKDVAGQAKDAAADVAGKVQSAAGGVADKVQSAAGDAADKAKDAAGKLAAGVSDVKADAKANVKQAGSKGKTALQTAGNALWSLVQRSPLQALVFLGSLIWLVRHTRTAAAQPPVSINDAANEAAGRVGTAAGQVQATLGTLGGQVQDQAQRGAGWFATTLQENPLALGAMAIVAGLGLGLSVPETSYEDKLLGQKRDELVGKVTDAAQDLTQKVTSVAQTAVHEAVEAGKGEAQKQGLTPEAAADAAGQAVAPAQSEGQTQS